MELTNAPQQKSKQTYVYVFPLFFFIFLSNFFSSSFFLDFLVV